MTFPPVPPRPWRAAWEQALYGPDGFFLRSVPGDHFRTNVAVPLFAQAVRRLAGLIDESLGRPDPFDLVDVGAGRGELLHALPDVPARWRLTGVDLAADPGTGLAWSAQIPELTGLLLANEWLDNVPVEVLQDGRLVLVDSSGTESLGGPAAPELLAWADRWWPGGGRVEVGLARDRAWAQAVSRVHRGVAVAVDYGHAVGSRRPTLTGYRDGRQVPPVPDGSGDLTSHVALDACAAGVGGAGRGSRVLPQHEALRALGVTAALPDPASSSYAQGLVRASQARELLDPDGLGGFGWLVTAVGIADPLAGWMER